MTIRRYRDGHGNECWALRGFDFSNDREAGEAAASMRSGSIALTAAVNQRGSIVHNGVEFYRNGSGGVAMRSAGRSFASILCSEANATPTDSD